MDQNIQVAIRVRPPLSTDEKSVLNWNIQDRIIFQTDENGKWTDSFEFDHIFDSTIKNYDIFNKVVKPMVESAMSGYNSTIFAYGQTASGKTHTMLGNENDKGLISLSISDVFQTIDSRIEHQFLLRASYIEIYNDVVCDLLDNSPKDIKILKSTCGNLNLNIREPIIHTMEEAYKILNEGNKRRKCAATAANQRSSRSHTIFRIVIESTPLNRNFDSDVPVQVSHLNLVDLAGFERVSQTNARGMRLHEGGYINKSLLALSKVIRQLSEGELFISFRDSKLTRLLKESLGGNTKTLIIGAVTPTVIEETHSTLTFISQAKTIKNKPTINKILSSEALTKQYIQMENNLRKQLADLQQNKHEIQEQHVRIVDNLNEQLQFYKQQFISSSKTETENNKEKRRHSMFSSSFQLNQFRLPCPSTQPRQKLPNKSTFQNSEPCDDNNTVISRNEFIQKFKRLNIPDNSICAQDKNIVKKLFSPLSQVNTTPAEQSRKEYCKQERVAVLKDVSNLDENRVQKEMKTILEENQLLKNKNAELTELHAHIKQENSSLKSELARITSILEETEDKHLSLNEQLDLSEIKNKLLQEELKKIKLDHENLKSQYASLQLKVDSVKPIKNCESATSVEAYHYKDTFDDLQELLDKLSNTLLADPKGENESTVYKEAEIQRLQQAVNEYITVINGKDEEISNKTKLIFEKDLIINNLKSQFDSDIQKLSEELNTQKIKTTKLSEERETFQDQLNLLEESNDKLISDNILKHDTIQCQIQQVDELLQSHLLCDEKITKLNKKIELLTKTTTQSQGNNEKQLENTHTIMKPENKENSDNIFKGINVLQGDKEELLGNMLSLQKKLNQNILHDKEFLKNIIFQQAEELKLLSEQKTSTVIALGEQEKISLELKKDTFLLASNLDKEEQKNAKLSQDLCNLQLNYGQLKTVNEKLLKEQRERVSQYPVLAKELAHQKQLNGKLVTECQKYKENAIHCSKENSVIVGSKRELEQQLTKKEQQIVSLTTELANIKKKSTEHERIIIHLRNQILQRTGDLVKERKSSTIKYTYEKRIKLKGDEIEQLDKEIIGFVNHLNDMEKQIKDRNREIELLKHRIAKLTPKEKLQVKQRRSNNHDALRDLNGDLEETASCNVCKYMSSQQLNRALLRENRRNVQAIAKLQKEVRKITMEYRYILDNNNELQEHNRSLELWNQSMQGTITKLTGTDANNKYLIKIKHSSTQTANFVCKSFNIA